MAVFNVLHESPSVDICSPFPGCFVTHLMESCHRKTGLKILVIFLPKEGLAGTSLAKPSYVMTLTIELYSVVSRDYILKSVSYQKLNWAAASQLQAFFGMTTRKIIKTYFCLAWLNFFPTTYFQPPISSYLN